VYLPFLGLLHSLPALYAPVFAPAEIGLFGWLLVLCAVALLGVSLRSFWRRVQNPDLDSPQWTGRLQRSSSYTGRKHERE
jgi:membrane protein implicated in regulation of membrane protease activity